jgi:acyl-CoA thioester hydrolase
MNAVIEVEERVRYSETDQMGVAHNKSYFEWFELGRTEFCRQKGIPYKDIEALGYYLVVVEACCKYRKPLRYDQVFVIRVRLREITAKKVIFDYWLLTTEDKKIVAAGSTVHIVTNSQGQVRLLPEEMVRKIAGG